MTRRTPRTPPVIAGHTYVRPLGAGGFAEVFLYEQDMPRRVVAVKVLDGTAWTERTRHAFQAEADVMARLSAHPAIISIYQASISADGRAFIAMEFCPETMRTRMKATPLTLEQILDVGVRLCGALETAHRSGVLHRDIKPSNVLVTALGRPVLADFGIAEVRGAVREHEQIALSYPWAAPEVVETKISGSVASEIWSLGATLYTFAAGRSPFESPDREQNERRRLAARISRALYVGLPNGESYGQLDEVLSRALRKNPEERYGSMLEFAEALRAMQRLYGYDVTPVDVISEEWAGAAPRGDDDRLRGPVVSTVRPDSRRVARENARGQATTSRTATRARPEKKRSLSTGAALGLGAGGMLILGLTGFLLTRVLGGGA